MVQKDRGGRGGRKAAGVDEDGERAVAEGRALDGGDGAVTALAV